MRIKNIDSKLADNVNKNIKDGNSQ